MRKEKRKVANYRESLLNALHTFFKLQNYAAKCFDAPFRDGNSGSERRGLCLKFSTQPMPEPGFEPWNYLAPEPETLQNMQPVF